MKEKGKKGEIRISVSMIHLRKEKLVSIVCLEEGILSQEPGTKPSILHNLTRGKASTHSWETRNRVSGKLSIVSFGPELSN